MTLLINPKARVKENKATTQTIDAKQIIEFE